MVVGYILLVWLLYYAIEGIQDAYSFNKSYKANDFDNQVLGLDIHVFKVLQRLTLGFTTIILMSILDFGYIITITNMLELFLMQPFISNGMYFYTRNKLNKQVYPKGFLTTKVTDDSSAVIDIDRFSSRLILFCLGSISYIIINYFL